MKNGEISPHWLNIVTNNCESATDENVDLANTWATDESYCEGDQIDPNLILNRSFISYKPVPTTSKVVSFEESSNISTPDTNVQVSPVSSPSIGLTQPVVKANDDLLIPEVGNLDTMTLRCSNSTPK